MPYTAPPRVPDELLADGIPDWAKMVWLAVRSKQGANDRAWHFYNEYAAVSGKSEAMVQKAVGVLKKAGWIEELEPASRGKAPVLRCLWKGRNKGENVIPTKEKRSEHHSEKVGTGFSKRSEQGSKSPTPPNKDESVKESEKESLQRAREGSDPVADLWGDFYEAYPKKRGKTSARSAWEKAGLDADPERAREIIADVERRTVEDRQWVKDGGRFVPYPATYLNQRRWEDEVEPVCATGTVAAEGRAEVRNETEARERYAEFE